MSYELLLSKDAKVEAVDTARYFNREDYYGVVTTPLHKCFSRNFFSSFSRMCTPGSLFDREVVYTYPDKSRIIANLSKGDYVPPGYDYVSNFVSISASSALYKLSNGKLEVKPFNGLLLNNELFYPRSSHTQTLWRHTEYQNIRISGFVGWSMVFLFTAPYDAQNRNSLMVENGRITNNSIINVAIKQKISQSTIGDTDRISLRIPGCRAVSFNGTVVLPTEDSVFTYEIPREVDLEVSIALRPGESLGEIEEL